LIWLVSGASSVEEEIFEESFLDVFEIIDVAVGLEGLRGFKVQAGR